MRRPLSLVLIVAITACSGQDPAPETTTSLGVATSPATSTTPAVSTSPPPTYAEEDVPRLASYLNTIEQGLAGTSLEGAAFEEPQGLISTGVLFCDLLDEGFTPIDVLRAWIVALSADGAVPTEDDLLLGGVVLGAAVRHICPQYLDDLQV